MTINKSIYLRADKKSVWKYLTEPDKLAIWFHKPPQALKAGEAFAMFGTESGKKLIWGEVLTADPHDLLVYTFVVAPLGDAVTKVTWTLEAVPGGTRLSLLHEGLPEGEAAFDLTLNMDKGWDDHIGRMRADLHEKVPA